MTTISERLREGRTPGTDLRWRVTDVHIEAADTIDALVAASEPVERMGMWTESAADDEIVIMTVGTIRKMRAALAKAKGKQA